VILGKWWWVWVVPDRLRVVSRSWSVVALKFRVVAFSESRVCLVEECRDINVGIGCSLLFGGVLNYAASR
jgi:hypothetical protein